MMREEDLQDTIVNCEGCHSIKVVTICMCSEDCRSYICDPTVESCIGVVYCDNCNVPMLRSHSIRVDDLILCVGHGIAELEEMAGPSGGC